MKKKHKISLVVGIAVLAILAVGGKIYMDNKSFNDEMVDIVHTHKSIVEKELRSEDPSNRIKKIEIDDSTIKHNPMGGIMFEGFVNGQRELSFSTGFRKYNMSDNGEYSDIESTGIDITAELSDYLSGGSSGDK
ncbi:DUF1310 family protein [Enterococcus wangshanyuanii]|uniref:DUF1310 domain-containing protein n=2 Tax=Enterococcus wangshanyuanii TaxID=2005703 RepID=A0ABQ1PRW7_9ENTE|nr:DUF1310 family protein [Enterococcus wangshanyuanii]GGD02105.1 hypothetical protein GCM10011573_34500 [Enterococcus wangshanyuanii]